MVYCMQCSMQYAGTGSITVCGRGLRRGGFRRGSFRQLTIDRPSIFICLVVVVVVAVAVAIVACSLAGTDCLLYVSGTGYRGIRVSRIARFFYGVVSNEKPRQIDINKNGNREIVPNIPLVIFFLCLFILFYFS